MSELDRSKQWDDGSIDSMTEAEQAMIKEHSQITNINLLVFIANHFVVEECTVIPISHCFAIVSHNQSAAIYNVWDDDICFNMVEIDIEASLVSRLEMYPHNFGKEVQQ